MRRKLTFIFLLALLISCKGTKEEYIRLGEEYFKKRKFSEALMAFRTAVDIDPNSAEAYQGIAKAYQAKGQITEAIAYLEKAVKVAPNDLELKVNLGTLYLLVSPAQIAQVESILNEIFAIQDDYIEAYILKAKLLTLKNAPEDQILAVFSKAINLDKNYQKTYLALARFYAQKGKLNQAEEALKKAISIEPSAIAFIEYGSLLNLVGRPKEAELAFQEAIRLAPSSYETYLALASFYLSRRDFLKAEQTYKQLVENMENSAESLAELANFYFKTGKSSEAILTLEEAIKREPESSAVRYQLTEIYLSLEETEKAKQQTEILISYDKKDVQSLVLHARVLLQQRDPEKAKEVLEEALRIQPTSKAALFYLIQTLLDLGQTEKARIFVADLEKYHPEYLYSKLLKAQIEVIEGNKQKALQEINQLLQNNSNNPEQQEIKKKALSARGLILLDQKKIEESEKDLTEALRIPPTTVSDIINLAKVFTFKRDFNQAIKLYQQAIEIDKNSIEALTGLVNTLKIQKKFSEAHQKIESFIEKLEKPNLIPAIYCLKAQLLFDERKFAESVQMLEKAMLTDENYLPAYIAYAELLIFQEKIEEALNRYLKIVNKRPSSNAYTLVAMLEEKRQNWQQAELYYRKALELNRENTIALNNLAWLIATQTDGNLDEALSLVQAAIDKNRKEASFYDTLGWVYYKKGLFPQAIESFKRAIALNGNNPAYRLRLAQSLLKIGEKSLAKKEIELAMKMEKLLTYREAKEARDLLRSL